MAQYSGSWSRPSQVRAKRGPITGFKKAGPNLLGECRTSDGSRPGPSGRPGQQAQTNDPGDFRYRLVIAFADQYASAPTVPVGL
jgi:hypothetical protein